MKKLHIIKIGGNVIDNETLLDKFLQDFAEISGSKILVHGGGKWVTQLAGKLNVPQTLLEGRRVTDQATLDIAVMVYAGLINKKIVSKLQSLHCDAFGLSGADGNMIKSEKRHQVNFDFGEVGDIQSGGVNKKRLDQFLHMGITPVFSAITHDSKGNLLNTNADTMASKIAVSMAELYEVKLTYCFDKKGVLTDVNEEDSFLPFLGQQEYRQLKKNKIISQGMIPKLENAFEAKDKGVKAVNICHAEDIYKEGTVLADTLQEYNTDRS